MEGGSWAIDIPDDEWKKIMAEIDDWNAFAADNPLWSGSVAGEPRLLTSDIGSLGFGVGELKPAATSRKREREEARPSRRQRRRSQSWPSSSATKPDTV